MVADGHYHVCRQKFNVYMDFIKTKALHIFLNKYNTIKVNLF